MLLKIGELAKRSGVTIRALRHYDEIGLLSPSTRSARFIVLDRIRNATRATSSTIGLPATVWFTAWLCPQPRRTASGPLADALHRSPGISMMAVFAAGPMPWPKRFSLKTFCR